MPPPGHGRTARVTIPDMAQPYYIRHKQQVKGPFPAGQIRQALLVGRYTLRDEVSVDRQEWSPILQHPDLVPDVLMGDPQDPRYQERLQAARRWADERRPAHGEVVEGETEQRRRPEDYATLEYRDNRESVYRRLRNRREIAYVQALGVGAVLLVLLYAGFRYMPSTPQTESQCSAPAAPAIDWRNCRLAGLQAIEARLEQARLDSAILVGSNLFGAHLHQAQLDYADLSVSNLSFADLRGASLKGTNLQQADLSGADLRDANLAFANLKGAVLDGSKLNGAVLDNAIWIDGRVCAPGSTGECKIVAK